MPHAANNKRTPRHVALVLCAAAVLSAAAGCAAQDSKASTPARVEIAAGQGDVSGVTIRFGDQNQLIKTVLSASGALAGTKYQVVFDQFTDGPHMNAAFSAGRIDAGFMGDTPVLFANAAKSGIAVLVAGTAASGASVYTLLAAPGSGIRSVADLKGKRVGFTRHTALEGWVIKLLQTEGLSEKDVRPVDLPILALVGALSSGQVDAVVGTPPGAQAYIDQHPQSVVRTPPTPVHFVIVGRTAPLAERDKATALLDLAGRLARAARWAQTHKEAFVKAYFVDTLKLPSALGDQLFNLSGNLDIQTIDKTGLRSDLETQHKAYVALGDIPESPPVAALFPPEVTRRFDAAVKRALAQPEGSG